MPPLTPLLSKIKILTLGISLSIFNFLLSTSPAFASPPAFTFSQPPLFRITSIGKFIGAVGSLLFLFSGVLFFIYLIWGGIQWISSAGDNNAIEAARNKITAALVGLSVVSMSLAIIFIVEYFFGITILDGPGAPALPVGY